MPISKELKTVSLQEQLKLHIPQEVLDKIRFTCEKINEVEWSGVLFYQITGSIRDTSNFSMEAKDILLMDKGNKTYTEYSFDQDVADYIMDNIEANPEFMQYKMGHIHSHNSMGVFFSGTDMGELFDNCVNHNFYLSLIVNNYDKMIAKLVYRATPCAYKAQDENGEVYEMGEYGNEVPILFTHDCIIESPVVEIPIEETFLKRLDYIIEKAKPKPVVVKEVSKTLAASQPGYNKSWDNNVNPHQKAFDALLSQGTDPKKNLSEIIDQTKKDQLNAEATGIDPERKIFFDQTDLENLAADDDEDFACYLMRLGEVFPQDNIEEALDVLKSEGMESNPEKLILNIMPNFGNYYTKFFSVRLGAQVKTLSMDDFTDTLQVVIMILEEHENKYSFLPPLIKELTELGIVTENKWREAVFSQKQTQVVN